jgi:hypothetical protein
MGFETIPGTEIGYGLLGFDADGRERREASGLMSDALIDRVSREAVTNVFFFCHGWKGDIPAARDQYNRWIGALMAWSDAQKAPQFFPGFRRFLMGLHGPREPWGDEELGH